MGLGSYEVYYASCNHCGEYYNVEEEHVSKSEVVAALKQDGWSMKAKT